MLGCAHLLRRRCAFTAYPSPLAPCDVPRSFAPSAGWIPQQALVYPGGRRCSLRCLDPVGATLSNSSALIHPGAGGVGAFVAERHPGHRQQGDSEEVPAVVVPSRRHLGDADRSGTKETLNPLSAAPTRHLFGCVDVIPVMPTEQILKLVGFIIGNRDVVEAATVTRMVKLVRRRRAAWALPFIGLSPPFLELSLSFP